MPVRLHHARRPGEKLEHPVDVVRAPVVSGAARDRGIRVPGAAGVRVTAHEGLDVEDLPEESGADGAPERHEVRIPPSVLVDGQHSPARRRRRDDLVGLRDGQAERLLAGHVLPPAQERQRQRHVVGRRCRDQRHLDVLVADELAHRRVRPYAREIRLRGLPTLDVGIDHGDQLEPVGRGHAEPVVVAHPAERPVADDAHADVATAAVQVRTQRPREQLGELGVAERRVRVTEAARDDAARPAGRLNDRGKVAERDAHVDDDLAVRDRDERHEPVDHRELARDAGRDVRVRLGDSSVVLAARRLGAGDGPQQISPEAVALDRRAADRDQRGATLDGRPERSQELQGLGGLRPVHDDRVALGDVRRRPAGRHESRLAELPGQSPERGTTILGETRGQDEDVHGDALEMHHLGRVVEHVLDAAVRDRARLHGGHQMAPAQRRTTNCTSGSM